MKKIFTLETGKHLWEAKLTVRYRKLAFLLLLFAPFAVFYALWVAALQKLHAPAPEWKDNENEDE